MVTMHWLSRPEQPVEFQPSKVESEPGVPVSVTTVPWTKLALQVPGQLIPPVSLTTEPLPMPKSCTCKLNEVKTVVKVAVTDWFEFIVTWQGSKPEPMGVKGP